MHLDNQFLIEKVKQGDKDSFTTLFRVHYPRIHSFLSSLLKDRELAEEITQDVFFRLWINREQLNPDLSFDSYLFNMAKNTVINIHKKRGVEQRYMDAHSAEEATAKDTTDTEEQLYYKELQLLIDEAVTLMPPQQQHIFRLSREQGLKNAEIAEKLNISKRTVEKHISNSLNILRKVIENNYLLFFV